MTQDPQTAEVSIAGAESCDPGHSAEHRRYAQKVFAWGRRKVLRYVGITTERGLTRVNGL